MSILETSHLRLRLFRPDDFDDLARIYADPEVRRYFPDGMLDRTQTKEELDWSIAGGDGDRPGFVLHALIERRSERLIGRAGLLSWEIDGAQEVEIAYLVDRSFWRRGYGGEIARALVRHGFETLGLHRLIALIHPNNTASIRTAERAGLRLERQTTVEGSPCLIYSISRSPPLPLPDGRYG